MLLCPQDIKSKETAEGREKTFESYVSTNTNRLWLFDAKTSVNSIQKIEAQAKKLKEVRDEFTKFETLSDAEKFESLGQGEFTRFSGNQKVFTSPFGDEAEITQRTKRLSQMEGQPEGGGKYVVYWGDTAFVKIGTETDGKMIRKDVWESRKKKMLTVAGEAVLSGTHSGFRNADFRLKTPENEFGKMVKRIDAFLKDSLLTNLR